MTWNPEQYLKFSEERSRPYFDLLGRVRLETARSIADLGCGPGTLTRTLSERWPQAQVVGVDNSPEMLIEAEQVAIPGRLAFVQADLATWTSDRPLDLIVSNAALQWVGDHDRLLAHLARMLAPGGTLAVQVPYHFGSSAHSVIEDVVANPRWKDVLHGGGTLPKSVLPMHRYGERLLDLGFVVDVWQTTYLHVLTGENPVLEWFKGTALRPILARLSPPDQSVFLNEVGKRFQVAYPARAGVTLLPFPRLFFVAVQP
jgi:trans-aconitate 2-methyltransferase